MAAGAAGAVAAAASAQTGAPLRRAVRVGFIGVGSRGTSLLRTTLKFPNVEVPAISDINETALSRATSLVKGRVRSRPKGMAPEWTTGSV
jgi:myo-inositol 2-dehydrogenase / D-chiro-inositol 1-dehydrogenase